MLNFFRKPQQQQQPYHWEQFKGQVPRDAVHASDSYVVIRAHHNNEWIPGKLNTMDRNAYISYSEKEVQVKQGVEVLVLAPGAHTEWVPASHGQVPQGAVGPIGHNNLYIGRAMCPNPDNKYAPGKIHPAHKCLYLPFGGKEMKHNNYEVLVVKEGHHQPQPQPHVNPFGPTPFVGPSSGSAYNWVPYQGSVPQNAVAASSNYVVIKALHNNKWMPGKLNLSQRAAYVPFGGKEVHVTSNIEILTYAPGAQVNWIQASNGQIPQNTVGPIGDEGVFVGRAVCPKPENTHTPGKIHPKYKRFYMPWNGKEQESEYYEACVIQFPQHNAYPSFPEPIHVQPGFGQSNFHQPGFRQPDFPFAPPFPGQNTGQFGQPHFNPNTQNMNGFGQGGFSHGGHFGSNRHF